MSLASSPTTPQTLHLVLEKIARNAGIGTAFITPEWWSDVRLLHIRDGVEPEAIARAFSVCVETNPAKVDFFARDFPRYVLPITRSEHVNPPAGVLEEMRHREEARRLRDDPEAQRKVAEICQQVPWKKTRSASEVTQ